MYVAVPEAGCDRKARTVDGTRSGGNLDRGRITDRGNPGAFDQNQAVGDRGFFRARVDRRTRQSKLSLATERCAGEGRDES